MTNNVFFPDSVKNRGAFLGVGMANDIYEPNVIEVINSYFHSGKIGYYEVYLFKDSHDDAHLRKFQSSLDQNLPIVWHCGGEFELAHPGRTCERYIDRFEYIKNLWSPLWCLEDIAAITFGGTRKVANRWIPVVPPPLTPASLAVVIENVEAAKRLCPIEFLPEIPYFPVPSGGTISLGRFMREIANKTDSKIVFDIGHYMSWNLLENRTHDALLDEFPWDAVAEIHLGGGFIGEASGRVWIDDHSAAIHEAELVILDRIIPLCAGLRGVLVELVNAPPNILEHSVNAVAEVVNAASRQIIDES